MDQKEKKERKVKSIQKYTFEIVHYEDGESSMLRHNEGFSVLEMLGIASMITQNLMNVLEGAIHPTEIKASSSNSPIIHT